jgi:hypothetical protein
MAIPNQVLEQLDLEKRELEDKIVQHLNRIKEINEFVSHANKLGINWQGKAMACIRGAEEPLTTDEILRCTFQSELHELENPIRRRNYILQLSLALNRLSNKGTIVGKTEDGYKGKFYYLREWEDESGNLKPEYKYYYERKINRLRTEKLRAYA